MSVSYDTSGENILPNLISDLPAALSAKISVADEDEPSSDKSLSSVALPGEPSMLMLSSRSYSPGYVADDESDTLIETSPALQTSQLLTQSILHDSPEIRSAHDSNQKRKSSTGGPLKKRPRVENSQSDRVTKTLLLACPDDEEVLPPLHCFIRRQIQVFTATDAELSQPAPGRKNPIQLGQVGIRCIHCAKSNLRVKRSVCYPSSVKRLYSSVSDMKFDHFGVCPSIPKDLQEIYTQLKAQNDSFKSRRHRSSNKSTAQHYHDSAIAMGLKDGQTGVFMNGQVILPGVTCKPIILPRSPSLLLSQHGQSVGAKSALCSIMNPLLFPTTTEFSTTATLPQRTLSSKPTLGAGIKTLSCAEDERYLNPLHCFVRRHIQVFAATQEDIDAPSPGRKSPVILNQVGVRCVHCSRLPPKDRVKRAVCYPPAVAGIYHAVSNMKFDHFGKCKGLSKQDREEFNRLREGHGRRSSKGKKGLANTTAQYYHDAAMSLGLFDTKMGIRMKLSEEVPSHTKVGEKTIPQGLSALVIASDVMAAAAQPPIHEVANATAV